MVHIPKTGDGSPSNPPNQNSAGVMPKTTIDLPFTPEDVRAGRVGQAQLDAANAVLSARLDADIAKVSRGIDELKAENASIRDALQCWPLQELLGMVEDSGDAVMWERARWFMEVRDAALRAKP